MLFIIIFMLVSVAGGAQNVIIRGIVRDSVTMAGIPYATVRSVPGLITEICDSSGIFEMRLPRSERELTARSQGYGTKNIALWTNSLNLYDIQLSPQATELREVVVNRQRYTKRNNPAVDFARRLRQSKDLTDPDRNDYYSYDVYQRTAIGLNDFDVSEKNRLLKKYPFLASHVDTSSLSGKPVLCLSLNESASSYYHRRQPEAQKTLVRGLRQQGVDEVVDRANMQTMIEESLGPVNLYGGDIYLLKNNFISPLSSIAPDFYKFFLTDTLQIEGDSCIVLSFYPRNHASTGFAGQVYVSLADTTMFVRRLDMHTLSDINLNFIDALRIRQDFTRAPDGSRLISKDLLDAELRLLPGTPQMYLSRRIYYTNHSFDNVEDSVFTGVGDRLVLEGAEGRNDDFWNAHTSGHRKGEDRAGELMTRLRQMPLYYWSELILKRLFTGYWPVGNSGVEIGPLNTIASYNSLEGLRLRAGGITTAQLSKRWFGRGYVAYGFKDHKWKYGAEIEFSFIDKQVHSREFPVHSLRLSHSFDVDRLGSHYLFTNQDNFVLSLTRIPDRLQSYRRLTKLLYTLELRNNFSVEASIENVRQQASRWVNFNTYEAPQNHFTENIAGLQLRYAPGEKFFQGRTTRFPANLNAPIFVLSHRFAPKGFLGSRYMVNRTEFNFSKRFWLSVAGSMDVFVGAGHVWSKSPFTELFIPNVNLSYTIQPQSYALLNPMEFVNSSYVSWELTYMPRGLLFNLIPGIKKTGLRELVGFRGLYGHLARRDTPGVDNPELPLFPAIAMARPMNQGPYMEISAGFDNLFRCLSLQYTWRLNYRQSSQPIDRAGIQIAVHLSF